MYSVAITLKCNVTTMLFCNVIITVIYNVAVTSLYNVAVTIGYYVTAALYNVMATSWQRHQRHYNVSIRCTKKYVKLKVILK